MVRRNSDQTVTDKYDEGDLDALSELLHSPGYAMVFDRIELEIERARRLLESPDPSIKTVEAEAMSTAAIRARIKALRMVLDIPGILKEEVKIALHSEGRDEEN